MKLLKYFLITWFIISGIYWLTDTPETPIPDEAIRDEYNFDRPDPNRKIYQYDVDLQRYVYEDELEEVYGKPKNNPPDWSYFPDKFVYIINPQNPNQVTIQDKSRGLSIDTELYQEIIIDKQRYKVEKRADGIRLRKVR